MSETACPRWCDFGEDGPHTGPHVHHMGEVLLGVASPSYVLAVTIESQDNQPLPVVTLGGRYDITYGSALLSWAQADRVAAMLLDARKRYA
jgi:hypothetical protein